MPPTIDVPADVAKTTSVAKTQTEASPVDALTRGKLPSAAQPSTSASHTQGPSSVSSAALPRLQRLVVRLQRTLDVGGAAAEADIPALADDPAAALDDGSLAPALAALWAVDESSLSGERAAELRALRRALVLAWQGSGAATGDDETFRARLLLAERAQPLLAGAAFPLPESTLQALRVVLSAVKALVPEMSSAALTDLVLSECISDPPAPDQLLRELEAARAECDAADAILAASPRERALEAKAASAAAGEPRAISQARALERAPNEAQARELIGANALLGLLRETVQHPLDLVLDGAEAWLRLQLAEPPDPRWGAGEGRLHPIMLHFSPAGPHLRVELDAPDGSGFDDAFASAEQMPAPKPFALCCAFTARIAALRSRFGAPSAPHLDKLASKVDAWLERCALPPPPEAFSPGEASELAALKSARLGAPAREARVAAAETARKQAADLALRLGAALDARAQAWRAIHGVVVGVGP